MNAILLTLMSLERILFFAIHVHKSWEGAQNMKNVPFLKVLCLHQLGNGHNQVMLMRMLWDHKHYHTRDPKGMNQQQYLVQPRFQ